MKGKPTNASELHTLIGNAVCRTSALEHALGIILSRNEASQDENRLERTIYKRFSKIRLADRIKVYLDSLEVRGAPKAEINRAKLGFKAIISWRNSLCHGIFTELDDGQFCLEFYDSKSFDRPDKIDPENPDKFILSPIRHKFTKEILQRHIQHIEETIDWVVKAENYLTPDHD
ncbi:hypothetical protein [Loktanella sp. DSM 29012]|uniref:hypothetical protein n=1 Tax=Loktanella sp. DSM 29012 TaxID=1881056 RepID=UPI00115FC40E|nr:hypothetical protein [Loktanella sp. DSM 29012]